MVGSRIVSDGFPYAPVKWGSDGPRIEAKLSVHFARQYAPADCGPSRNRLLVKKGYVSFRGKL